MTKGGFPMTFNQFCIKFLAVVSLFAIAFGFMAWAMLMDARWMWLIAGGVVVSLLTAYADWVEQHRYY